MGSRPEKSSWTTSKRRRRPRSIKARRMFFHSSRFSRPKRNKLARTRFLPSRPRPKAIALTNLDIFGIEEEGEQIGIERASIAQFQFVDEVAGDGIEFLLGGGQSHFAQGGLGGVDGAAGSQQIE